MSVDPINPDQTDHLTGPQQFDEGDELVAPAAAADEPPADWAPQRGDVVRLDDPDDEDTPARYALYVDEDTVVPLTGATRYELQLYPAG